jgi:hypothetical protein
LFVENSCEKNVRAKPKIKCEVTPRLQARLTGRACAINIQDQNVQLGAVISSGTRSTRGYVRTVEKLVIVRLAWSHVVTRGHTETKQSRKPKTK